MDAGNSIIYHLSVYLPSHEKEKGHFSQISRGQVFSKEVLHNLEKLPLTQSRLISSHLSWAHPTSPHLGRD